MPPKQKLYCYVDETGQDTKGQLFLVSVIVSGQEKEILLNILAEAEKISGKGRVKWMEAKHEARLKYIKKILATPELLGKMHFALFTNTKDYFHKTAEAAARTIQDIGGANYEAIVLIDGLPGSLIKPFGSLLRRWRVKVKKVRGIRKAQADELMRLANAVCGFVRLALHDKGELSEQFYLAKRQGFFKEILGN